MNATLVSNHAVAAQRDCKKSLNMNAPLSNNAVATSYYDGFDWRCKNSPLVGTAKLASCVGNTYLGSTKLVASCVGSTKLASLNEMENTTTIIMDSLEAMMEQYCVEKGPFLHQFLKSLTATPKDASALDALKGCLELAGADDVYKLEQDHTEVVFDIENNRQATILSLRSLQDQYPYDDPVASIMEEFEMLMGQCLSNGMEKAVFVYRMILHLNKRQHCAARGEFGLRCSLEVASATRFGFHLSHFGDLVYAIDHNRGDTMEALWALYSRYQSFQARRFPMGV